MNSDKKQTGNLNEDDLVLCTVKRVEGTTVFVDLDSSSLKGTIVFSEISAGRIRNIRDYVSPNKKIVCKVLRIYPDHIELSFRRVTAKERDEVLEKSKKSTTLKKIISSNIKDSSKIIEKISEEYNSDLSEFLEQVQESPEILDKYFSSEDSKKLQAILSEKTSSKKTIKKVFILKSIASDGIEKMKLVLSNKKYKDKIKYIGSSQFSLEITAEDYKSAEAEAESILSEIESLSKKESVSYFLKDKK